MKMYTADICGDCRAFKALMIQRGIEAEFEAVDITQSVMNLREFLALRDHEACFDAVRAAGSIGIPCFVRADGQVTLSEDVALSWIDQPPMPPKEFGCEHCK